MGVRIPQIRIPQIRIPRSALKPSVAVTRTLDTAQILKDDSGGQVIDMEEGDVSIKSDLHAFVETNETRKHFGSKASGILSEKERLQRRKLGARGA